MENLSGKSVLLHIGDENLNNYCSEALQECDLKPFSPALFPHADIVLTDRGVHPGPELPGYVPVLLFIDDESSYPRDYYTQEIDLLSTDDQIRNMISEMIDQADTARQIGLPDLLILDEEALATIAELGGNPLVVDGLKKFIKNTTLLLNECRFLIAKKDLDHVRFHMHAIKGNAITLGGDQFSKMAAWMEEALKSENYHNFDLVLDLAYTLLASFSIRSRNWSNKDSHK